MCRLLGYVARTPTTLAALLGDAEFDEFTELSLKHRDGWGFAWATAGGVDVVKSPDAARDSPLFAQVAHEQAADLGLLHLRWATLGLPVLPENTHPFTDGTVAFAHNGSIKPPESLDPLVPADLLALMDGTTDSERYFLAMLGLSRESNPADGLAGTVARIASTLRFGSLNSMVATPTELIVACRFDPVAEAKEAEPDYYHIGYRVTPDAIVVSSSGWGAGWQTLENGQMLTIQRGTLDMSIRQLPEAGTP
ncbi:MAG: class glutamine amidotransferase [Rhodoglobus sp.]|nr:class glutamine amidotransferase [Rhodoglobus sp.]